MMDERQKQFLNLMQPKSCAIFFSSKSSGSRSSGWPGSFTQEANFWYLLPIEEDESALIFFKDENNQGQIFLFCTEKNEHFERWHGSRIGVEGYQDLYPDIKVSDISLLEKNFRHFLKKVDCIYYGWGVISAFDLWMTKEISDIQRSKNFSIIVKDWRFLLQQMRCIKSHKELVALKKSAHITRLAFDIISKNIQKYRYEFEIQSDLYSIFSKFGACPAYPAIVASGSNGLCLHYSKNSAPIGDDQGIVVDAGSQYLGYASDVTRTFFIGAPSVAWEKLYQLVKETQTIVIKSVGPGCSFAELEKLTRKIFVEGLVDLGLLSHHDDFLTNLSHLKKFYPHSIGHWIGVEVHDLGPNMRSLESKFLPGMVITIEPGLYIPKESAYGAFAGLCIRIEDVIHVTPEGYENLTESILK